jgi:hypothetical protein
MRAQPRRHLRVVLRVARDPAVHRKLDVLLLAAGAQQHAVQVAAMHDRIRILEARPERLAEVDAGDFLGAERVHQAQRVDINRHVPRRLADAEIVEGVERIGAELDAGADLAERRRLFEHENAMAFLGEPERGREAADAAAGDQNAAALSRFGHGSRMAWASSRRRF